MMDYRGFLKHLGQVIKLPKLYHLHKSNMYFVLYLHIKASEDNDFFKLGKV